MSDGYRSGDPETRRQEDEEWRRRASYRRVGEYPVFRRTVTTEEMVLNRINLDVKAVGFNSVSELIEAYKSLNRESVRRDIALNTLNQYIENRHELIDYALDIMENKRYFPPEETDQDIRLKLARLEAYVAGLGDGIRAVYGTSPVDSLEYPGSRWADLIMSVYRLPVPELELP